MFRGVMCVLAEAMEPTYIWRGCLCVAAQLGVQTRYLFRSLHASQVSCRYTYTLTIQLSRSESVLFPSASIHVVDPSILLPAVPPGIQFRQILHLELCSTPI